VARPELGIKRQCQNCGAKFYDLGRSPPVCPKCGTVQQPTATAAARPRAEAQARVADVPAADPAGADVELVSLEEADQGADTGHVAATKVDLDVDDEVADDHPDDADTDDDFLEEDEEDDDNVARLIDSDIEDDEES
jgi:uncharacterized protein (TIGR02300 family)